MLIDKFQIQLEAKPETKCFACNVPTTLRKKYLVLGEYVENFTCDAECEATICDFYEAAELKQEADHVNQV